MREIELLAPAKNLECGMAAIDHGADAVYIGAPSFGARAAAGNTVEDIAHLCRYAHTFGVKVYVTVNTLIYDNELDSARRLLVELQAAGADAVLVQDMGLMELAMESRALSLAENGKQRTERSGSQQSQELPIEGNHTCRLTPVNSYSQCFFHASTQTDNRTAAKVRWLRDQGFRRVVLARELSVEEIAAIHHDVPDVELEVFVHGALCVSYSGVCYASQYCFGRSANRGACAQFCRLKFDLIDADGRMIERGRHLLSLKDLCQKDRLEKLMEAGATSFKIEGRLKDVAYVKNVTAAYSQRLNEIIARQADRYRRASRGRCTYYFEPSLKKTFNRGFTHYFLDGRRADIFSPDTPKAIGECVGRVKEVHGRWLTVAGTAAFANGDGLCFVNGNRELEGFRVNRAEGNRLFPLKMPPTLKAGTVLYRNSDVAFERLMGGRTAERKLSVSMTLEATDNGFELHVAAIDGSVETCVGVVTEKQLAQKAPRDNIVRQLSKLGGTPFECLKVTIVPEDFNFFIPSSVLADLRRKAVEQLLAETAMDSGKVDEIDDKRDMPTDGQKKDATPESVQAGSEYGQYPYLYNIANSRARTFYECQGLKIVAPAFEIGGGGREPLLMQCRHCLKYSLGYCTKQGRHGEGSQRQKPWREPLFLVLPDGRRFRLEFRCKECQMNVYGA